MSDKNTLDLSPSQLIRAVILAVSTVIVLPALVLLGSAGRWDWGWAWVYLGISLTTSVVSRVIMARIHPDMLRERAGALSNPTTKEWDRVIVPIIAIFLPLFVLLVAGLDERFGWTPGMPLWARLAALVLLLAGYGFATWAFITNRFFSATVRIQTDRGHQVVCSGPYALIRHPGYAGGIISYLAVPILLGSWWAMIPAVVEAAGTLLRTHLEDRTLQAELPGYREYAEKVRFRVLPGVW